MYPYTKHFKAKAYHIGLHGPSGSGLGLVSKSAAGPRGAPALLAAAGGTGEELLGLHELAEILFQVPNPKAPSSPIISTWALKG